MPFRIKACPWKVVKLRYDNVGQRQTDRQKIDTYTVMDEQDTHRQIDRK